MKGKHKKRAKKSTHAKNEQTAKYEDSRGRVGLKAALSHAFSSGWVQNSGVGFLLALIALIVAIVTATQIKTAAITFALVATAFVWILAGVVVKSAEAAPLPFTADPLILWVAEVRDGGQIFAAYNKALTHVPLLVNMRVVNLQDVPSRIKTFKIEIKSKQGRWIFPDTWLSAVLVPESMPLVWVNLPPNPSLRMQLIGDRLESVLNNRPLQAHETVTGWVALDVPPEYDTAVRPLVFRISIKDTAGHGVTVVAPSPNADNAGNIVPPAGFGGAADFDITGYQITHWADGQTVWVKPN